MSDGTSSAPWGMRAAYLGLAMATVFFLLLPLETTPRRWAGPDLVVLLTYAWALRRPDHVPALLVAFVFLMIDLLFQRPPGLLAAFMVLSTQALKQRAHLLRDQTFPVEWLSVTMTLVAVMLGNRLVLALLLVPQAPVGLTVIQLLMSILFYPLTVLAVHFLLGVRRAGPGAGDTSGLRS